MKSLLFAVSARTWKLSLSRIETYNEGIVSGYEGINPNFNLDFSLLVIQNL